MSTLKEKFEDEILLGDDLFSTANQCEKIADDYAIKFADWVNVNAYKHQTSTTTPELLEIFKSKRVN